VHGRAPGREVAAARRRATAHTVLVVVASGVEIREWGQGERPDLAVVEELVGRAVREAGGAAGDSREIEEQLRRRSAGRGGFRSGGGAGFVVLEVRADDYWYREGVRVKAGFTAGKAERRLGFAGGDSLHCPLNS
jgi:hypothetical protein